VTSSDKGAWLPTIDQGGRVSGKNLWMTAGCQKGKGDRFKSKTKTTQTRRRRKNLSCKWTVTFGALRVRSKGEWATKNTVGASEKLN